MKTLFDAATEMEMMDTELSKIKVMLENVTDATWEYTKHDKMFAAVADSTYIMTFADIAHDYTWELMKKVKEISEFLYEEHRKGKGINQEEPRKVA